MTRYTTIYLGKPKKGKTQQNFLNIDYQNAMAKEQGLIRERDKTPSIRAKTPKTLVLLLLCPSFFLSLAQYMSALVCINEGRCLPIYTDFPIDILP